MPLPLDSMQGETLTMRPDCCCRGLCSVIVSGDDKDVRTILCQPNGQLCTTLTESAVWRCLISCRGTEERLGASC